MYWIKQELGFMDAVDRIVDYFAITTSMDEIELWLQVFVYRYPYSGGPARMKQCKLLEEKSV